MIRGLQRFAVELRRRGIRISPGEWLDAVRALECVGLDDRGRFRDSLRAAWVKRRRHREIFDNAFEEFFAAPSRARREGSGPSAGVSSAGRHSEGETGGLPTRTNRATSTPTGGIVSETDQASRPPTASPRRRAGSRVQSILERVRRGDHASSTSRLRGVLLVPERAEPRTSLRPEPPDRRELRSRMTVAEEGEIARSVRRCIDQIRLCHARRHRPTAKGRLYLRRMFRDSLSTGGVPFRLPRRSTRRRPSRIVLFIDVSWSVARSAGLFLSIAEQWIGRSRNGHVLFFVDRPVEASAAVETWLSTRLSGYRPVGPAERRNRPGSGIVRGGVRFTDLLRSLPGLDLDAPSDYGRAFDILLRTWSRSWSRKTTLVILGDGRTNRYDPQAWALEEIAARCGSVVWLVPEGVEEWGTGDSALADYLDQVDLVVEARDLAGLARGVVEIARRG